MIETVRKPSVHDQVLVEAEIDGKLVGFRAAVVNVMPGTLWLSLTSPDSLLAQLRPGDPLTLTFRRDDTGMVAASSFLGQLGSAQSRLFSVEMPEDCRLVQRRAHLRLNTECPVQYTLISRREIGAARLSGRGTTRNISAGGLQFMVKAPIGETVIVGDVLEIRLALGRETVLAEAEVLRVEDALDVCPDERPHFPAITPPPPRTFIAVRFVTISTEAQDRIVRHIFVLQRLLHEDPRRSP